MKRGKTTDLFAERFNLKFEQSNLSARALGRIVEVSDTTIHNWRRGDGRPVGDKLPDIAKALRTTVAFLLGETDEEGAQGSVGEEFQVLFDLSNAEHLTYTHSNLRSVAPSHMLYHVVATNEMEPEFKLGTILICVRTPPTDIQDGGIYLYAVEGELPRIARMFWEKPKQVRLEYANPTISNGPLILDDDKALQIFKVRQSTSVFP